MKFTIKIWHEAIKEVRFYANMSDFGIWEKLWECYLHHASRSIRIWKTFFVLNFLLNEVSERDLPLVYDASEVSEKRWTCFFKMVN